LQNKNNILKFFVSRSVASFAKIIRLSSFATGLFEHDSSICFFVGFL
jgi:hypothetical protein